MKKSFVKFMALALVALLSCGLQVEAQNLLRGLKQTAQKAVQGNGNAANNKNSKPNNDNKAGNAGNAVAAGKTFYVSQTTGSARADGLTPGTAMKDLQKAIDTAEDNDIIYVAEGNYLGNMDRGYIQIGQFGNGQNDRGKFLSIYGGWSPDFSERDIIKHVTKLQPVEQRFSAPLFNVNARRPYGYNGPMGNVVIDGLVFDLGENNLYCKANVDLEITGTPNEGVLTGRFVELGASPNCPLEGYSNGDEYGLHMDVEGMSACPTAFSSIAATMASPR